MLANGDFESISEGKPVYWEKFGGTMFADGDSAGGSYAACLESETTSIKWLYQIVRVEPGGWYGGSAQAKVSGAGEASIRISWYTSGDGSGSQIDAVEGSTTASASWSAIGIGPVQAPDGARSARYRLSLRPSGNATACFDNASFQPMDEPPVAPAAPAEPNLAPTTGTSPATPTRNSSTATPRPSVGGSASPASPERVAALVSGGNVRISEILSDPDEPGRDADYEWVELTNVGSEPANLDGWRLGDANRSQVLTAFVLAPGSYVVVAGQAASLLSFVPTLRIAGGTIGNGLGNTGDAVRLLSPAGDVVDEVSYGDDQSVFEPAPQAPGKGRTLGVRDPSADPASENWAVTLRPTAGEPNVFPAAPATGVAGAATKGPKQEERQSDVGPAVVSGGGGSNAPWMVLIGLGGLSIGAASISLGPRVKSLAQRARRG
jgi:hypothetical protein